MLARLGLGLLILLSTLGCANQPAKPAHSEPLLFSRAQAPAPSARLSQADLRDDVRELVRLLEESHPDPYIGGGGRVAFHRRARALLDEIPPDGLTARAFLHALRPFVASVRDGHTNIGESRSEAPGEKRIWVELDAVEERLYVSGVYREDQRRAIGGKIRNVEGVAWAELVRRSAAFRGYENAYGNIVHLAEALSRPDMLAEILGREESLNTVQMELERPDGAPLSIALPIGSAAPGPVIRPPSRLNLPKPDASAIAWGFLTEDRSVAMLRVDSMMRYREAFETWRSTGYAANLGDRLTKAAEESTGGKAAQGIDEQIALIPSATEALEAMVTAMRAANSKTLIVDLRKNEGGNSLFTTIFGYFFYSIDRLLETDEGYQIPRFSRLYFENNRATSLERVRSERSPDIELGDLDFSKEVAWRKTKAQGLTQTERERRLRWLSEEAAKAPSFDRAFRTPKWNTTWPGKIIVLTSARTYSSGYLLAAFLYQHGASVVGVPSSQAGNCFIDALQFDLKHSGLHGTISYKRSVLFPDDARTGEMLRPSAELTYEGLAKWGFDPNAAVLVALEASGRPSH